MKRKKTDMHDDWHADTHDSIDALERSVKDLSKRNRILKRSVEDVSKKNRKLEDENENLTEDMRRNHKLKNVKENLVDVTLNLLGSYKLELDQISEKRNLKLEQALKEKEELNLRLTSLEKEKSALSERNRKLKHVKENLADVTLNLLASYKLELDQINETRNLELEEALKEKDEMNLRLTSLEEEKSALSERNGQLLDESCSLTVEKLKAMDKIRKLSEEKSDMEKTLTMFQEELASADEMKEKIRRLERDKQELEQTLEALSQEALQVPPESNLKDAIKQVLECPVCLVDVQTQAFQCSNGHLICSQCIQDPNINQACPVCRVSYNAGAHRNLVAEDVARALNSV